MRELLSTLLVSTGLGEGWGWRWAWSWVLVWATSLSLYCQFSKRMEKRVRFVLKSHEQMLDVSKPKQEHPAATITGTNGVHGFNRVIGTGRYGGRCNLPRVGGEVQ